MSGRMGSLPTVQKPEYGSTSSTIERTPGRLQTSMIRSASALMLRPVSTHHAWNSIPFASSTRTHLSTLATLSIAKLRSRSNSPCQFGPSLVFTHTCLTAGAQVLSVWTSSSIVFSATESPFQCQTATFPSYGVAISLLLPLIDRTVFAQHNWLLAIG